MNRSRLLALWLLCGAAAVQSQPAPSVPATDVYHGVEVADPFRNLEDLKSPATRQWLLAQGEQTTATLARIEGRDALRGRIAELSRSNGDVAPVCAGAVAR